MSAPFYIGYRRAMAPEQARFLRMRVATLLVALVCVALSLVRWQRPFASSRFEYGVVKTFEGFISEQPYPTLIATHPIDAGNDRAVSRLYLVAPGKHGAQSLVAGLDGRSVRLDGSLIYRDNQAMIEVRPQSTHLLDQRVVRSTTPVALGTYTLRGEIVDSKCYLGVMKPGNLKPHKACAIRCISGGCTPVLVVRDAAGSAVYVMLAGADGRPVNREVLDMVAVPLEVTGRVERQDNLFVLKSEPSTYRRLP
ncbi:MAG: hypothetical protein K8T26_18315 [Lentisphaerae bacterium]|nr:hypothetical protein [Lentisphaerota bacterium]